MRVSVVALGVAAWASPSAAFSLSPTTSIASKSSLPLASSSCSPAHSSLPAGLRAGASASVGPSMAMGRREALLAGGFLGAALCVPSAAFAEEAFDEVIPGSDGMGVDLSVKYPKGWVLERKPGTLIVNDDILIACDTDPDKCVFGDVTMKPKVAGADGGFIVVRSVEGDVSGITKDFVKKSVFGRGGKFGAFGAPEDVKFLKDEMVGNTRLLDVKFTAFSPGGTTIARKGIVALSKSGPEVYMLVATTSAARWGKSEVLLRDMASSLKTKETGRLVPVQEKDTGMKKSMFAAQNEERARLEREREKDGIQ
uniref:PsbP C-terminal domain-containing protein n=1 Tax=Hemiselmis andersenii TaxID=464988 RepID=A0A6U4LDD6_HEMAN|mmetsp:Transcript_43079/g.100039  ORF Transcript_43079/g.100039 Transcript_43079/m.100039 type:complete len:311 (+) Transcript_43079:24-956(+)